jgi:hypothetical protein
MAAHLPDLLGESTAVERASVRTLRPAVSVPSRAGFFRCGVWCMP